MTESQLNSLLDQLQNDEDCPYTIDYWDLDNPNPYQWAITLRGPNDSPYEGGYFLAKIIFKSDYPNSKPEVYFKTKIYHLNVSESNGHCCFGSFKGKQILDVLSCLNTFFINQNPKSPYDSTKANLYTNKRSEFNNNARNWTREYATLNSFDSYTPSNFPK